MSYCNSWIILYSAIQLNLSSTIRTFVKKKNSSKYMKKLICISVKQNLEACLINFTSVTFDKHAIYDNYLIGKLTTLLATELIESKVIFGK